MAAGVTVTQSGSTTTYVITGQQGNTCTVTVTNTYGGGLTYTVTNSGTGFHQDVAIVLTVLMQMLSTGLIPTTFYG
jgi:hypothetical protein